MGEMSAVGNTGNKNYYPLCFFKYIILVHTPSVGQGKDFQDHGRKFVVVFCL